MYSDGFLHAQREATIGRRWPQARVLSMSMPVNGIESAPTPAFGHHDRAGRTVEGPVSWFKLAVPGADVGNTEQPRLYIRPAVRALCARPVPHGTWRAQRVSVVRATVLALSNAIRCSFRMLRCSRGA